MKTSFPDNRLTATGNFVIGCNYWASHAGIRMWKDWQAETVEADLMQLASEGIEVLRVFPLWPDFQPLHMMYSALGKPWQLRYGEHILPPDSAGVDEEAMNHFSFIADTAEKHGLSLVVGLVTGWMSGRLFVPPAFERLNCLTDPLALKWQIRFVRHFVKNFKDYPAIIAWDLGNECNCIGLVDSPEAAWNWTHSISSAIRIEDDSRPVVSGMHSLLPGSGSNWRIQDQGELTDLLTTHPYPIFTPHCDRDPINEIRNTLHATAECAMYRDIAGTPCLAEELGTLGPTNCNEKIAADYIRTVLFSLWANDCHGLLWWCAYDQEHLDFAPYDHNGHERELGLIRSNREIKPVLIEMGKFRRKIESLGLKTLIPTKQQAVCILTDDQDSWGAAYSSYVLAKQAGFNLRFSYHDQYLPEAQLYMLPSVSGAKSFSTYFLKQLFDKARGGATVYFSSNDSFIDPFQKEFGFEVLTRERRNVPTSISGGFLCDDTLELSGEFKLSIKTTTGEALAVEQKINVRATVSMEPVEPSEPNPVFIRTVYGKGTLYYLSFSLETYLAQKKGAFDGTSKYYKIYSNVASDILKILPVQNNNPSIGITYHELPDGDTIIVAINYSSKPQNAVFTVKDGFLLSRIFDDGRKMHIENSTIDIRENDGVLLVLTRSDSNSPLNYG